MEIAKGLAKQKMLAVLMELNEILKDSGLTDEDLAEISREIGTHRRAFFGNPRRDDTNVLFSFFNKRDSTTRKLPPCISLNVPIYAPECP
ncbi:hypothetical protein [Thermococcus cleftensis]|uniref:hypothetical protein n=1 Tax=Thermococcus cleftensis (strain DSM 27260 / KACC 17922 / CL1) TaxID=163003 RepID=UPI00064E777F|nr:hypothetical protein [Thermococcus cleftensis]